MGSVIKNHPMTQTAGFVLLSQLLLPCPPCLDGLIPGELKAGLNLSPISHLGPGTLSQRQKVTNIVHHGKPTTPCMEYLHFPILKSRLCSYKISPKRSE